MITKEMGTECSEVSEFNLDNQLPFVNDDFSYEGEDEDLEKIEDNVSENFEDVEVDMGFLSNINKTVIENLELKPKKNKNEGDHPIDSYLRGLILDVLVKDFMPILQKQLLIGQITKKEEK